MSSRRSEASSGDVRILIGILRRRKWIVLGMTLLTTASAAFFSYRQTPIYESTARVLVKPLDASQALGGYNYNFLISMGTETALAQSPAVANKAADIVEQAGGSPQQDGTVSVNNPADTTFLDITYADPDAARAQRWARGYAFGYIQNRQEQALSSYRSAASGYDQTISNLQGQIDDKRTQWLNTTDSQQKSLLREQLDTLQQQLTVVQAQRAQLPIPQQDAAQIIDPPDLPSRPASPNHIQDILLGFLAGLALGIGLAFLRERLDDRLAGREDLEMQTGAPTLAIVPSVRGWRRRKSTRLVALSDPTSAAAEAYRTVRANLQFIARDGQVKTLAVTSPSLGEGKTTTTADLAVTLASTGKRVVAVSCDLRRPRLHAFFGLQNGVGLTDFLRGEAGFSEVTQRCSVETLRIISSGTTPPNPAELLASDAMGHFLSALREHADFVLLDTPPILAVSDALLIAPRADGTIIIVDADRTSRSAVAASREQLEQVGARIVGGILNNLDPRRARTYPAYVREYYGYRYRRPSKEAASSNGKVVPDTSAVEDVWR